MNRRQNELAEVAIFLALYFEQIYCWLTNPQDYIQTALLKNVL